jgi:hypothetical protein
MWERGKNNGKEGGGLSNFYSVLKILWNVLY